MLDGRPFRKEQIIDLGPNATKQVRVRHEEPKQFSKPLVVVRAVTGERSHVERSPKMRQNAAGGAVLTIDVMAKLVSENAVRRTVDDVAWPRPLPPDFAKRRARVDPDLNLAVAVVGAHAEVGSADARVDAWTIDSVDRAPLRNVRLATLEQFIFSYHFTILPVATDYT